MSKARWGRPLVYAIPLFVFITLATHSWFRSWASALALGALMGMVVYGGQFYARWNRR